MAKKTDDMVVVTIGVLEHLLLPTADGLKVVALLRNAVRVDRHYGAGGGFQYTLGERPECELRVISPRQLLSTEPVPRSRRIPPRLGYDGGGDS